jgi:hypothetical protein
MITSSNRYGWGSLINSSTSDLFIEENEGIVIFLDGRDLKLKLSKFSKNGLKSTSVINPDSRDINKFVCKDRSGFPLYFNVDQDELYKMESTKSEPKLVKSGVNNMFFVGDKLLLVNQDGSLTVLESGKVLVGKGSEIIPSFRSSLDD